MAPAPAAAFPPTAMHGHAWIRISRGGERKHGRDPSKLGSPDRAGCRRGEIGSGGKRWGPAACMREEEEDLGRVHSPAAAPSPPDPRDSTPLPSPAHEGHFRPVGAGTEARWSWPRRAPPGGRYRLLSNADCGPALCGPGAWVICPKDWRTLPHIWQLDAREAGLRVRVP